MTAAFIKWWVRKRSGLDQLREFPDALFLMIVVDHKDGVNHAPNPYGDNCQQNAEEKTSDPACHQHSEWRENDAEEIAQRVHGTKPYLTLFGFDFEFVILDHRIREQVAADFVK